MNYRNVFGYTRERLMMVSHNGKDPSIINGIIWYYLDNLQRFVMRK